MILRLNIKFSFKNKSGVQSYQGNHTDQLDFCNWLANRWDVISITHHASLGLLMSTFLIRYTTSRSGSYLVVLTRLGGPRSRPNPFLKLWKYRESNPLNQRGGHIFLTVYNIDCELSWRLITCNTSLIKWFRKRRYQQIHGCACCVILQFGIVLTESN